MTVSDSTFIIHNSSFDMSFSPLGNYLPILSKRPINKQAATALALEAGTAFIAAHNEALIKRTRLVSIKGGMVHALATSAPAKEELLSLKEPLFLAMKKAAPLELADLRVEIRGTLVEEA
jgi:hypothetical protein